MPTSVPKTRRLIVNADDFGQSPGVNRGVIQAHERGILTSTTLMVRWPAAGEAAVYARQCSSLAVGLHLDLGEWELRDGEWARLYQVVDETDAAAVDAEVARQVDVFHQLVGRPPTHLDSHQHVHLREPARTVVLGVAERLGVPVRGVSVPYCGRFYGQDEQRVSHPEWVSVDNFIAILADLPPGTSEMGCHPADADDLNTMYRTERLLELSTLCDARVRSAIESMGIELTTFANLQSGQGPVASA